MAAAVATTHALTREPEDHDSVLELRSAKDHGPASTSTDHVPEDAGLRADVVRGDVQLAFAALPDVKPSWTHKYEDRVYIGLRAHCRHRYFKILVVGEAGLGKTTLMRNMLAPLAQHAHFPLADAGAFAGMDIFANSPEKLCTEVVVRDEQRRYVDVVM